MFVAGFDETVATAGLIALPTVVCLASFTVVPNALDGELLASVTFNVFVDTVSPIGFFGLF